MGSEQSGGTDLTSGETLQGERPWCGVGEASGLDSGCHQSLVFSVGGYND